VRLTPVMKRPNDDQEGGLAKAQKVDEGAEGELAEGGFVIAVVKQTMPYQGVSILSEDPHNEAATTYKLDHRLVGAKALEKSSAYAFQPQVNEEGELCVAHPMWLLLGRLDPEKPIAWGKWMGTVHAPSPTGDAFVDCEDVKTQFGREAFIFRKVVTMCEIVAGDEICFDVHVSGRNMPQVSSPIWKKHKSVIQVSKGLGKGVLPSVPRTLTVTGAKKPADPAKQQVSTDESLNGEVSDELLLQELARIEASKSLNGEVSDELLLQELARIEAFEKGEEVEGGAGVTMGDGGDAEAEGLRMAVLKETHPEKGFSFLTSDPSDDKNTIYIHHTVASPAILEQCHVVAFKPHTNAKGEIQASAPVWLLLGRADADTAVSWGRFKGIVARIADSGDAWVSCPEVEAEYGKEPYIFRKVVGMCGLNVGDEVCFDLHTNEKGSPQLSSPVWKKNSDRKPGAKGQGKDAWSKGGKDGWAKGGWGKDGWGGKDAWSKDGWGKDGWSGWSGWSGSSGSSGWSKDGWGDAWGDAWGGGGMKGSCGKGAMIGGLMGWKGGGKGKGGDYKSVLRTATTCGVPLTVLM